MRNYIEKNPNCYKKWAKSNKLKNETEYIKVKKLVREYWNYRTRYGRYKQWFKEEEDIKNCYLGDKGGSFYYVKMKKRDIPKKYKKENITVYYIKKRVKK